MVVEIDPVRLTRGYERKPYFWLDTAAEGVVFQAPVNGATTPNSENPRSELRQLFGNGDPASWSNKNSTWQMEAEIAVTHYPNSSNDTRGVVCMQIHDGKDDVSVLRFERSGKVWITQGDNTHYDKIIDPYALGDWNWFRVVAAKGGGIAWYLNSVQVATLPGTFSGCYFKAGCYTQGNESNSTEYGAAHFRYLKVTKRA